MPVIEIYHQIPRWTDPRLKRHYRRDSRSKLFIHDTRKLSIVTVQWALRTAVLNQGQVGKCTAEATEGVLATDPYYSPQVVAAWDANWGSFDDAGTDQFYNSEEGLDGDGPYPPQDNGSSGLTSATVLRDAGLIPSWTQTFDVPDTLKALSQGPVSIGIPFFNSMMTPNADGILTIDPTSGLAGGHQMCVDGYDSLRDLLHVRNSWGTDWGVGGWCWISSTDFGTLLTYPQFPGDVTIFGMPGSPATIPSAPVPSRSAA
jgi:hypothetical protein